MSPSRGSTPRQTDRQTDWLTISRNVTLTLTLTVNPCGGGVEYLHRDPASRRRRRKGKSQIWRQNMVASPKGLWPEKDYPGKGQQHMEKIDPSWGSTPRLTDRPTVSRNVALTLILSSAFDKLDDSRIRQEDVFQGSSVVNAVTLRELFVCHRYSSLESVIMNCSYDVWNYPINGIIRSRTHYLQSRYQDTRDNTLPQWSVSNVATMQPRL
jgi:hypothetical protein